MKDGQKLFLVKILHTLVWFFFNVIIFYMLYASVTGRIDVWFWICYSLVLVEGLVLLIFRLRCPLTLIARRYTEDDHDNFDIFLPEWLARHTKRIYTSLVALITVIAILRLIMQ